MTSYMLEILNPDGSTKDVMDNPISIEAARSFNTDGSCSILLPYNRIDYSYFNRNTRLVIWRTDDSGRTEKFGDTVWFAKRITRQVLDGTFKVDFVDAFALLKIRIVGYTPVTPYADKTLEEFGLVSYTDYFRIDNLMRAYMRENFGSLAINPKTGATDTPRIVNDIVIEGDKNLAPYGEKQAGWANIADVLRDLARMSAEKGMELFYDLVPIDGGRFEFRVWNDVRGVDRGSTSLVPLEFTDESGSLADIEEVVDFTETKTACYALGYDTDNARVWEIYQSSDLINNNPFLREEFTVNVAEAEDAPILEDAARGALNAARPIRRITARVIDGGDFLYGRNYRYGDKVVARILDDSYDCQINSVRISWQNGEEDLDIRLTGSKTE